MIGIKGVKKVYAKMIAAILIPTVLIFGSMGVIMVKDHEKSLQESMATRIETTTRLLNKISISSYQNFDYTMLDELAAQAADDPDIVYVSYLDPKGRPLTKVFDKKINDGSLLQYEKKIFGFENDPTSLLGVIRIGYSTHSMNKSIRHEIQNMVIYTFLGFVLFLASSFLLIGKLVNQLKNALETTKTIINHLPFGMVLVNRNKQIQSVNQTALNIMRLDSDQDLIGKICHNKICPADECNCPVLDLGQAVDSSERTVLDKDGGKIPVMKSVIQINLDGQDVLLEAFVDISQSKKIESALANAEKKTRTVLETSAEPMVVYDKKGRATFINPAFERVFGWKPEEFQNKKIDFVPKKALAETMAAVAQLAKGQSCYGLETIRNTKNGDQKTIRVSASPIMDETGHYTGSVVNLQDISELVASRQAAEAANQAKSEFLANMSHEIRTPMNGVIGMTGLLLDTRLTAEQRRYAETVRASGESLLSLINDILDFSKIEAQKLDLEIIDFDLQSLLDDFAATLALQAHEKGLELVCSLAPEVPALVRGDPGRLRQILTNLAGNAVKFTPAGEVAIHATLESVTGDAVLVRFAVRDTGIGIPQDKMERLFKAFEQVDASTTRKFGGTGLGLTISKQLAEMMGGAIGVKSIAGQGSTFWFTASLDKQPAGAAAPLPPSVDISGVRVLIVDDNATNREIFNHTIDLVADDRHRL
jgi:PAS domain S-box-containing protein